MNEIDMEIGSETMAEITHRAERSDIDPSDVVRAAVELYLQLENPEEVICEPDS